MSHVVVLNLEIKSLEAVKRLCQNLGWEFLENKQEYTWYGRWVGDYNAADAATQNGITPEQLGKCDHAIRIPGITYELGLKRKGDQYVLLWDFWDSRLKEAMGGSSGSRFLQEYGKACVTLEAEQQGYSWQERQLADGTYEIEVETF